MLTLSTHDTKRSGDVRARLHLLSEIPEAWEAVVARWGERNERYRSGGWPDRNAEYLLYQTLIGAWPVDAARAQAFMEKATKEAKVHTSWIDPRPDYDEAVAAFVAGVLADEAFVAELEGFLAEHRLVDHGRVTSLAQTALLLTCPGVPDVYQGTELWDLSLVDPDNRRPVDYGIRRRLLETVAGGAAEAALAHADDGGPKLWLIHRLLAHRRSHPDGYDAAAGYEPLPVTGAKARHAVAFTRSGRLATVVPRLPLGLAGDWGDTVVSLPAGRWVDVLTGDRIDGGDVPAGSLLRRFPVAVLGKDS